MIEKQTESYSIAAELKSLKELDEGITLIMRIIKQMSQANKIMEKLEAEQTSETYVNSSKK